MNTIQTTRVALVSPRAKGLGALARGFGSSPVIGVDGGIEHCHALFGRLPDLGIGDGDSISKKGRALMSLIPFVELKTDKDQSDLQVALLAARQVFGAREVYLFGFFGGRPDHHLANLLECVSALLKLGLDRVLAFDGEGSQIFTGPSDQPLRIKVSPGQLVSLFSLHGQARVEDWEGLHYRLPKGEMLKPGSRGLSNFATKSEISLKVSKGVVGVVLPRV